MRAVARAIFDNYLFAQPQVANLDRRTVALNYRFHFHLHLQDAAVGTADNETRQVFFNGDDRSLDGLFLRPSRAC